jgi:hypothetical protein
MPQLCLGHLMEFWATVHELELLPNIFQITLLVKTTDTFSTNFSCRLIRSVYQSAMNNPPPVSQSILMLIVQSSHGLPALAQKISGTNAMHSHRVELSQVECQSPLPEPLCAAGYIGIQGITNNSTWQMLSPNAKDIVGI